MSKKYDESFIDLSHKLETNVSVLEFTTANTLRSVLFVNYYNHTFLLKFKTHPSHQFPLGTWGYMRTGGYYENIKFYHPLSLKWKEHRLTEFNWIEFEPIVKGGKALMSHKQ
jgi:hypothetical protein